MDIIINLRENFTPYTRTVYGEKELTNNTEISVKLQRELSRQKFPLN